MAVIRWTFPNGNNGDTLTASYAGGDTTNLTGGTAILSNSQVFAGMNTLSAKFNLTTNGHLWYAKEGLSTAAYAYDIYFYQSVRTGTLNYIGWAGSSSSARSAGVSIGGVSNRITLNTAAVGTWASGNEVYPDNTWIRLSVYVTCGAGTGTARVVWYAGHSTTPMGDTGTLTGLDTQTTIDRIRIGGKAALSGDTVGEIYIGSWAYDTTATGLIPPYTTGTSVTPWLRGAGAWAPVSMREREVGVWSPRNTLLK